MAVEVLIKAYGQQYSIFRFFNVCGYSVMPSTNEDGVFGTCRRAMISDEFNIFGNDYDAKYGTCVRDDIRADDIAAAIVRAVEALAANTPFEPLGSGKSCTFKLC